MAEDEEFDIEVVRQKANEGDSDSMYQLGFIAEISGKTDDGIHWYEKAAAKGHPQASIQLAQAYFAGKGVKKSVPRGLELLERASSTGDCASTVALGDALLDRLDVLGAEKLYAKVAQQSEEKEVAKYAMFRLGCLYHSCEELKNSQRAYEYLKQAADQDHADSQYNLACMLQQGDGVPADVPYARLLFARAASSKHEEAIANLAIMLESGEGGAAEPQRALAILRSAASKGIGGVDVLLMQMQEKFDRQLKITEVASTDADATAAGSADTMRRCDNLSCDKVETQPNEFKCCARCSRTFYCGRECQMLDWTTFGHKLLCKK
eukprot:TRINITY_DN13370_c0_g1_i1.p1 TRINITY_DN13370_c0_g1~~TRINITY_DN13370_c0_g1_i1.p1  ORF type:complete len:322 (-),score=66.74 TRINITY_DN13370_c0_g1_i1:106-1071(-)